MSVSSRSRVMACLLWARRPAPRRSPPGSLLYLAALTVIIAVASAALIQSGALGLAAPTPRPPVAILRRGRYRAATLGGPLHRWSAS